MAELLGVISAGFGIASFALQISGTIQALRRIKNGEAAEDLNLLSDRLEILHDILHRLEAFEEHSAVSATIKHCQQRYSRIEGVLAKLLAKFPGDATDPKYRLKRLKIALSRQVREDVRDIRDSVNDVILQLHLSFQSEIQLSPSPGSETLADVDGPSRRSPDGGSIAICDRALEDQSFDSRHENRPAQGKPAAKGTAISLGGKSRPHVCGTRHCNCSCHLTKKVSGRFWSLDYTPLSIFFSRHNTRQCDSSRLRLILRLALSRYGIPKAVVLGLDLVSAVGGFSLQPGLKVQSIVNYTSPGFETLWRCKNGIMSLENACMKFTELYRTDPTLKDHRNPSGNSYIRELLCRGPWVVQQDQFDLLQLFVCELGMTVADEDQSFLVRCAGWIGEGWHLELLNTILEYGFDPTMIDSPLFERWPTSCNPDWFCELVTPDPFFIEYIATIVRDHHGFAGSTPLHNAILNGSLESVKLWIARSQPLEDDVNFLGQTPLHIAVTNPIYLQLILDSGHDLDVADKWGTTALMYAAGMGCVETAVLLISSGANPYLRDRKRGISRGFIDYAFARGHWHLVMETLQAIRETYGEEIFQISTHNALLGAISCSKIDNFKKRSFFYPQLIELSTDVNFTFGDSHHETKRNNLMHHAGSLEEARALCRSGFDSFNQPNSEGDLALNSAARKANPPMVKFCLENGTDVNHVNRKQRTVLFDLVLQIPSASRSIWDVMDSVLVCLEAGADVFLSDSCRCACFPHGCEISAAFRIEFNAGLFSSLSMPDPIWTLEWSSLVEEYRGAEASKRTLLSFIRRATSEDEESCVSHVCCHRGSGITGGFWYFFDQRKALDDEDISDILVEEVDFIKNLDQKMELLASASLEQLRTTWISSLKEQYKIHLDEVERKRNKNEKEGRKHDSNGLGSGEEKYQVDYKNDDYRISYPTSTEILEQGPHSIVREMAEYAVWLEGESFRSNVSPFSSLHRDGWYDRRINWLVELMDAMGVMADEIALLMNKKEEMLDREEGVDIGVIAASFLASIERRRAEISGSVCLA
ncbi:hypothetical protein AAE478_007954 [Parahypoxylon ruwenzoriense]